MYLYYFIQKHFLYLRHIICVSHSYYVFSKIRYILVYKFLSIIRAVECEYFCYDLHST